MPKTRWNPFAFLSAFKTRALVAIMGMVLTGLLGWRIRRVEQTTYNLRLENDVSIRTAFIHGELQQCLLVIEAVRSYLSVAGEVDHDKFTAFTTPFLPSRRGLQGLAWAPRISGAERVSFEQEMNRRGFSGFHINERNVSGLPVRAQERNVYFPLRELEPVQGNAIAYGFDLGSDPARRAALEEACDTGKPIASARLGLLQKLEESSGFMVCSPVYRPGAPLSSVEQRRRALQGFVSGLIQTGGLMNELLEASSPAGLGTDLLDYSAPSGKQLLQHWAPRLTAKPSWMGRPLPRSITWKHRFAFAGRDMGVEVSPNTAYLTEYHPYLHWLVIFAGAVLTLLVFALLRLLSRKESAERLVQEGTARLLEAEEEMREITALQALFLENSTLGIAFVRNRIFEWTNARAAAILGRTPEQLKGTPTRAVYASEHAYADQGQRMYAAFQLGKPSDQVVQLQRGDGSLVWCRFIGKAVDPGDPQSGSVWMVEDITEQRRTEESLRQAQKLESLGLMAGGIAHEINTPTQFIGDNTAFLQEAIEALLAFLKSIQELFQKPGPPGAADLDPLRQQFERLDMEYLEVEIPRAIQQSLEGVARVSRIVRAMKDFSHPSGASMLPVDLNQAIESTLIVSGNAWKYVAELETDFDPKLPPVPCFRDVINQVILNLVVNAAHAMEAAGAGSQGVPKGTLRVATCLASGQAEIRIQDTGTGIPEEIRSKIFQPFFTTKPIGKGTGQGLAMVHAAIVAQHKGSIAVETEVGRGTTFILRIPIKPLKPSDEIPAPPPDRREQP